MLCFGLASKGVGTRCAALVGAWGILDADGVGYFFERSDIEDLDGLAGRSDPAQFAEATHHFADHLAARTHQPGQVIVGDG